MKKPYYTAADVPDADASAPGEYPYTRGIHAEMYQKRLWTMRQYAGMGTAAETNARFKALLEHGQTGLSTAFDLPTQLGLDSDDSRALGEVGQVGVAIDSLADMEDLFAGIPLDRVSTSMTINAPAAALVAMYVAVAEKQGVPAAAVSGTAQNDVLKEFVARGTFIHPPRPSLRLAVDLIAWCAREAPKFNAISVSGYHMRDAGLDLVREMAFALANAIAYVEATVARGIAVDEFAPRISWIFNTHNGFLEEVAKYRALRRLWATLMRERFTAKDPKSWMLRTHSQTGGVTLPAQQPENNVARAAFQAMAAALGGVQSLALSCYDEALALPTDFAQQLALRTQQILAHETGIRRVADPLGGSWYVEWLTDRLEAEALEQLAQIERLGGAVAAIEQRRMQRAIEAAAWAEQRAVEAGERVVVGVNRYAETGNGHGPGLQGELFRLDAAASTRQCEALARLRRERDGGAVAARLAALRCAAADAAANLMPVILDAVRVYATVGEISDALRDVFGVHRERN